MAFAPSLSSTPSSRSAAASSSPANGSSAGQHLRLGLHQGDLGAQRRPRLGQLAAHRAPAQDGETLRDRLGGRGLPVGPRRDLAQAGDRRDGGTAADGDHHRPASLQDLIADPDQSLALEPGLTAVEDDAALLDPRELRGIVEIVDDLVAAGEHDGRVKGAGHRLRGAGDALDLGQELRPGRSNALDGMHAQ